MKSFLLFVALIGALALSSSFAPPVTSAANTAKQERAVIKFTESVTLMGVTLKGEYLFLHDDNAMARGEACTYVYEGQAAVTNKLVASFHCRPAIRNMVGNFTARTGLNSLGQQELREYQFAGSVEAHRVPLNPHEGHVIIADLGM